MAGKTCSACGAPFRTGSFECPRCGAKTLPPPGPDGTAGETLAPPADVFDRPSDAFGGDQTIQESPPSDRVAGDSDAATLKAREGPETIEVASPLEGGEKRASSNLLPSKESGHSSGQGRSSLLQSGFKSGPGGEGGGELFDNGRYEILKEIARGGMGAVYKARQRDLNRIVALKVMLSGALASEDEKKRFLREAEASAKLKHPNIVPVYDIGEVEGNLYFTMDFVEGAPLSEKKKEFDRARLLDVMIKVTDAVAYAHMRGIIHRDLKPANVMMDVSGEPKIMDFGLAKEMSAESASGDPDVRTREGSIMGTPHYMPPEQAEGLVSEIDVRSDVYALGVILYELWTGRLPFNAKRVSDLMRLVLETEPPSPRSIDSTVPWELEAIALKAMEKTKAKRYETALDMKRDLERFKNGEAILARKANVLYRARKWARKNRYPIAGVAATIAVGSLLAVSAYRQANAGWRHELEDAAAKIEKAEKDIALADRDAQAIPSLLDAAEKTPDLAKREDALHALLERAKKDEKETAEAKGSLGFREEVARVYVSRLQAATKSATDLGNQLEKWQEGIVRAQTTIDRARNARALLDKARASLAAKATSEARSSLMAAAELGAKDEAAPLLTQVEEEENRALEKQNEAAAENENTSAHRDLAEAAAAADTKEKFTKIESALAHVREGLKIAPSKCPAVDELAKTSQVAEIAYAEILASIGAFDFAEIKAKPYAEKNDEQARKLIAAIEAKRADTAINDQHMSTAEEKLGRSKDAEGDERRAACDVALSELGAMRTGSLDTEGRKRFEDLARRAKTARLAALVDLSKALVADKGGEAGTDARFDDLSKQVALDPLPGAPAIDTTGAAGFVLGNQGRFHLGLAESKRRSDPLQTYAEAERARTLLENREGFAADLKAALEILAQAKREKDRPTGMILVPQLDAVKIGGGDRNPERTVQVHAFYVGEFEVKSEEFLEFVKSDRSRRGTSGIWDDSLPAELDEKIFEGGRYVGPLGWEKQSDGTYRPPVGQESMAVSGVSYYEARAYARFRGGRLPTDEEWEVAARARRDASGVVTVREYPWDGGWKPELASARAAKHVGADGANPADVSSFGCHDMAGNVAEWVDPSSN
jgi:formylglycine-generating enzyme required for sulfatase activity/tRNA A-37 threonylcarbamoyl transferase component Bud32